MRLTAPALALALAATATSAEDLALGREIAEEFCTRCHDINPGGAFKETPPSFQAIAIYRDPDQVFVRIMYPPIHAGMPRLGAFLMSGNVEAVTAYIVSLDTE